MQKVLSKKIPEKKTCSTNVTPPSLEKWLAMAVTTAKSADYNYLGGRSFVG